MSEEAKNNGKKPEKKKLNAAQIARILDKGGRIFELVKSGASWRSIAAVLQKEAKEAGESVRGCSYENCRLIYGQYVELLIQDNEQEFDEWRTLLIARLDDVYLNYFPYARAKIDAATDDNTVKLKMKAGDVIVKAVNTQADLLGIKKPQRVELTGGDGKPLINPVMQVIVEFSNEKAE